MSLMIKGMDMLKYNGEHKEFDRYGCYLTVYKNGKVKLHICDTDYDVVEVSTPHGGLIDADMLMDLLEKSVPKKNMKGLVRNDTL